MSQSSQSPGDLDYSTDQTTRIARRVAHGVYHLTHGGQDIGEEVWGIFALRNGGHRLMTEIDSQWPVPNQQRVHLDVDDHWNTQGLWAQVDLNNLRRMASYIPSDRVLNIEIMEARLHDEDDRSGRTKLRGKVKPSDLTDAPLHAPIFSGKPVLQRELPFDAGAHLDFASALFNFVVLQRLQQARTSQATFDSVVLTLPSLEPLSIQQTYRYVRAEALNADPTQPLAHRYSISEAGSPGAVTTFWADGHGIAVKQELMVDGAPHGCEMVSYRWQG